MPSWTSFESRKGVDYEQVINVLAMDKSMLEEELRATKSKLKLYDRYLLQMQVTKQMLIANACCKCNCKYNSLQQNKCLLQMLAAKQILATKQMLAANAIACSKAYAYCKCLLQ
ncbi:hypothetical protein Tco_0613422 [Tanacetum coccineum]